MGAKSALMVRDYLLVALGRFVIPYPRIHEGLRLRMILISNIRINLIVVTLRVEWRINIAEINGIVSNLPAQNFEVIAVI